MGARWYAAPMRFALLTLLLGLAVPQIAEAKNPWEELMGRKPRTWTDPEGRFSIDLPVGWTAKPQASAPIVDFWKRSADHGAVAHVTVTIKPVPPGVNVRHLALHVEKDIKARARGFQVVERGRLQVGGQPAVRTHFTYRELGNVQLVNEVDQYVLVIAERAFILTFEHAYGARPLFEEDFGYMVKGFSGRGPGERILRGKKKRRRVRAGEMVNPDAVRY